MSLLVHYTLKDPGDHAAQVEAMNALVAGLKSESPAGVHYSCFETGDPAKFVGVLEFEDDDGKQRFLQSEAFASYRAAVTDLLAGPPETTEITAIASTRA